MSLTTKTTKELRNLAQEVLKTSTLLRCSHGYNDEEGDFDPGACEEGATHEITGPHDEPGGKYCEAHATEVHNGIMYKHRWMLFPIHEAQGVVGARKLAKAVLEALHD